MSGLIVGYAALANMLAGSVAPGPNVMDAGSKVTMRWWWSRGSSYGNRRWGAAPVPWDIRVCWGEAWKQRIGGTGHAIAEKSAIEVGGGEEGVIVVGGGSVMPVVVGFQPYILPKIKSLLTGKCS